MAVLFAVAASLVAVASPGGRGMRPDLKHVFKAAGNRMSISSAFGDTGRYWKALPVRMNSFLSNGKRRHGCRSRSIRSLAKNQAGLGNSNFLEKNYDAFDEFDERGFGFDDYHEAGLYDELEDWDEEIILNIGFIGTGTITEAVVKGLCDQGTFGAHPMPPNIGQILVSPRNSHRASKLATEFDLVKVAASNEEVVEKSDIIFIALTPEVLKSALKTLQFRKDQQVVSFVSTSTTEELRHLVTPCENIHRAIPMPPIARKRGPLPIYIRPGSPDESITSLLKPLGTLIRVEKESDLQILMSVASSMAPYYNLMSTIMHFTTKKGLAEKVASKYIGSLFTSLAQDAEDSTNIDTASKNASLENIFDSLTAVSQTPGGLNEQALKTLREQGFYGIFEDSLESVHRRIVEA